VLSETVDALPHGARDLLRLSLFVLKVGLVIVALQGVGGVVAVVVGAVTTNGRFVMGGMGQVAVAGVVFAVANPGSEYVTEVTGSRGTYIIRTSRQGR
jgi:hypothetical protein